MRAVLAGLLLLSLLAACAEDAPVCSAPYIAHGQSCCLDKDGDSACDPPAQEEQLSSCDLCPPKFVTQKEEIIVYRYVCMNGSVMERATDCEARIVSDAHLFSPSAEQDGTLITAFDARPACRGEYPAAEIHLEVTQSPLQVIFEVQEEPEGSFRELASLDGAKMIIDDEYFYVGFCSSIDCTTVTDAQLPSEGAAAIRAALKYPNATAYTRELLVDPTPEGEYGRKRC